jgi:hypothetical protein
LTDEEWMHVAPLIPPNKPGGNKRSVNVREVMNGIMYILSTGCQWRAIPKDLPPRSTLFDYLDLWSYMARSIAFITRCMWRAASKVNAQPVPPLPSSQSNAAHA